MPLTLLNPHDAQLSGDVRTNVTLNYEWRQHIHEALCKYFLPLIGFDFENDDTYTTWQNFAALLVDLYTEESVGTMRLAARYTSSTNQAIAANVAESIIWDAASQNSLSYDTLAAWRNPAQPAQLICPKDGYYHVSASARIDSAAASIKRLFLVTNVSLFSISQEIATSLAILNIDTDMMLVAGEVIFVQCLSISAGTIVPYFGTPNVSIHEIAPL